MPVGVTWSKLEILVRLLALPSTRLFTGITRSIRLSSRFLTQYLAVLV